MTNTANLSEAAKTALINSRGSRQGAPIPERTAPDVIVGLRRDGLIGTDLGLTRKGTIVREALVDAKLDELF